jgi:hypothetical protein
MVARGLESQWEKRLRDLTAAEAVAHRVPRTTRRSLSVRAFAARAATMPSADSCCAIRVNRFTLSRESTTRSRSPEVSSTAFSAQPPDLPPAPLMDMGFAVHCPLARCRRPHHPVLVHRLAPLLHASFRPHLTTTPLRFAITFPPSGCEEDFHLQAVKYARHTAKGPAREARAGGVQQISGNRILSNEFYYRSVQE